MSQQVATALRRLVQERARGRCEYCLIHESDQWADHFRLEDGHILPLTPIGRATEYLLQFNRSQSVQERRWLIEAGRYPRGPTAADEPGYPP